MKQAMCILFNVTECTKIFIIKFNFKTNLHLCIDQSNISSIQMFIVQFNLSNTSTFLLESTLSLLESYTFATSCNHQNGQTSAIYHALFAFNCDWYNKIHYINIFHIHPRIGMGLILNIRFLQNHDTTLTPHHINKLHQHRTPTHHVLLFCQRKHSL